MAHLNDYLRDANQDIAIISRRRPGPRQTLDLLRSGIHIACLLTSWGMLYAVRWVELQLREKRRSRMRQEPFRWLWTIKSPSRRQRRSQDLPEGWSEEDIPF